MVVRWVSKPCSVTLDPQACAERIKNDESGEAHCTGQVRRFCRKTDGKGAPMGVPWLVWSMPLTAGIHFHAIGTVLACKR